MEFYFYGKLFCSNNILKKKKLIAKPYYYLMKHTIRIFPIIGGLLHYVSHIIIISIVCILILV